MKRLLLLLPMLFIAGCGGYGSMTEGRSLQLMGIQGGRIKRARDAYSPRPHSWLRKRGHGQVLGCVSEAKEDDVHRRWQILPAGPTRTRTATS